MSHFKEVEFELGPDPGDPKIKPAGPFFDRDKLNEVVNEINKEFESISNGTSKLTPYPIDYGNFAFPTGNRLSILKTAPTKENYLAFLEIAKQDLGQKAAVRFMELLKEAKAPEEKNV